MNRSADEVRGEVSQAYARAAGEEKESCCSSRTAESTSCCGRSAHKGGKAQFGGYSIEELLALPDEAVANSFGCGNPVSFAGMSEGDTVLDLGSGAGIDLLLAARKAGPTGRVIGVDMTDQMIAKAQAVIEKSGMTNVEVRKGIIEDLPIADESIDWVISNCVINLSPEKPCVFREIMRVLKPGGHMLVSDIVATNLPESVRELAIAYSSCLAGAISEEAYLDGLSDVGLVDIEVRDRLVYDASQLLASTDSAIHTSADPGEQETMRTVITSLEGRVWSVRVHARKPLINEYAPRAL
jgi:arsenite methyltransferase